MPETASLEVAFDLRLPLAELEFRASRSGGPGGQHVNTSSTRVELWWDVANSPTLSDEQRRRLVDRLATRLDGKGRLRVVAGGSRSQLRNREEATERLRQMVAAALVVPKARKRTRPSRAEKAGRPSSATTSRRVRRSRRQERVKEISSRLRQRFRIRLYTAAMNAVRCRASTQ
jgi:ribosome-associated protein